MKKKKKIVKRQFFCKNNKFGDKKFSFKRIVKKKLGPQQIYVRKFA